MIWYLPAFDPIEAKFGGGGIFMGNLGGEALETVLV